MMSTLLFAGVPLVQSFDIIAKSTDVSNEKRLLLSIKSEVEGGCSLSKALMQHPRYFDPLTCHLVAVGEASGTLDTMFSQIATYKEKAEKLNRKIKKALFYPTIVISVAITVTAILLMYVVPQFEQLFQGMGAELPYFTRLIIHLSRFMQHYFWLLLILFISGTCMFHYYKKRSKTFELTLDKFSLNFPIIGKILHKACIARISRTLATTLKVGLNLIPSLEAAALVANNRVYTHAMLKIKEEIKMGKQIHSAMKNTGVFEHQVIQLIAIGEEAGDLDKMFDKIALIYEEEVDALVDNLSTLLEPFIMIILGILVGGLVISMYLPMFKIGSVL